ncbi:MAG: hypothetical protein H6704_31240 [Myxococcales bacterium]|nr:hypothetical protein [Myxococcales bacterium]
MRVGVLAAALAWPGVAAALWEGEGEGASAELTGSVRAFGLVTRAEDVDRAASLQRLRLGLTGYFGEAVSVEVAGDGVLEVGQSAAPALAPPTRLRVVELGGAHAGEGYVVRPDLDRAVVAWTLPWVEARVGRQAIGHGSARLFPASDLFAPFAGFALDTEYKRGVDAVRVTATLGALSEVEVYGVGHADGVDEGMALARGRTQVWAVDVSALAGVSYGEATVGLDLQGDVGGTGWYLDALARPGLGVDGLRATLGLSHHFEGGLTVTAEGHVDGGGAGARADYLDAATRLGVRAGESYLLGRGYAGVAGEYEVTPLLRAGMAWFQNAVDGSALLTPTLRWDVGQETVIDLGALWAVGDRGDEFADGVVVHGDVRVYF